MSNKNSPWLKIWKTAVRNKHSKQLSQLLFNAPDFSAEEQTELLTVAIRLASSQTDLGLLTEVFSKLNDLPELRANALTVALELADERKPNFSALLPKLSNGEQVLILASLLEASRQEPSPELRLYRLSLLLDLIPEDVRSLYWSEANSLALLGGDDAQLLLLKLANRLSRKARNSTHEELAEAVSRLKEPYKYAQATALLSDLGVPLSALNLTNALNVAKGIPDPILRVATETRLNELNRSNS